MSKETTFRDIVNKFFATHGKLESQQAAYDALEGGEALFPEYASLINSWRYCAAALLPDANLALQIMQEGLDAGYYWPKDFLTTDEDLKLLQELPEFKRIVEIAEQKYQEANAASKPVSLALADPAKGSPPYPLLLPLHGNNGERGKVGAVLGGGRWMRGG